MACFCRSLIAQYREQMGCLGQTRSFIAPAHCTFLLLSQQLKVYITQFMFVWQWAEAHTQKPAVQRGFLGEKWTWWVSLTFLSLARKKSFHCMWLHVWQVDVCLLETCQGLTFCKSKLQKVKPTCQCRLRIATSLLTGVYVCPCLGLHLIFCK